MFFASKKKYKKLKMHCRDLTSELEMMKKRQIVQLEVLSLTQKEVEESLAEATKYKRMYADEVQKRLELADRLKRYEEQNEKL